MKVSTSHLKKVTVDYRFPEFTVGTQVALKSKPEKRIGVVGRVLTDDYMVLLSLDMDFGPEHRCALAEFLVPFVTQ
jgi:hypothetical protein